VKSELFDMSFQGNELCTETHLIMADSSINWQQLVTIPQWLRVFLSDVNPLNVLKNPKAMFNVKPK